MDYDEDKGGWNLSFCMEGTRYAVVTSIKLHMPFLPDLFILHVNMFYICRGFER